MPKANVWITPYEAKELLSAPYTIQPPHHTLITISMCDFTMITFLGIIFNSRFHPYAEHLINTTVIIYVSLAFILQFKEIQFEQFFERL